MPDQADDLAMGQGQVQRVQEGALGNVERDGLQLEHGRVLGQKEPNLEQIRTIIKDCMAQTAAGDGCRAGGGGSAMGKSLPALIGSITIRTPTFVVQSDDS